LTFAEEADPTPRVGLAFFGADRLPQDLFGKFVLAGWDTVAWQGRFA
jgi:hypothetical protein